MTNGIATKGRFNSGPRTFQADKRLRRQMSALADADRLTNEDSLVRFRQPIEVKAAFVIAVLRQTAKAKGG